MFGWKPYLPTDLLFGMNTADLKDNSITYIEKLKKKIEWAYQTANEAIKKEQERNKQQYDHKVRCTKLMVGDKILLRHTAFKGKHKIQYGSFSSCLSYFKLDISLQQDQF